MLFKAKVEIKQSLLSVFSTTSICVDLDLVNICFILYPFTLISIDITQDRKTYVLVSLVLFVLLRILLLPLVYLQEPSKVQGRYTEKVAYSILFGTGSY